MTDRSAQRVNEVGQSAVWYDDEVHATLFYAEVLLQLDRTVVLWISVEQVQALLLNQWQNTLGCCRSQVDQVVQVVHSHARR